MSQVSAGAAASPWHTEGDWYVLHTKSRQEKTLADSLTAMGISHYLPLVVAARYYGKRKLSVELPLFPGYLFVHGSLDQAYEADRTGRVAQIIRVVDQHRIDWELKNLHQALSAKVPLSPAPFIREGVRVEVRSGPFRGLQGIVEGRGEGGRFLLQVHTLGRAVSLEIDRSLLDVIDGR
jgi:transcription antitermination factor NusG